MLKPQKQRIVFPFWFLLLLLLEDNSGTPWGLYEEPAAVDETLSLIYSKIQAVNPIEHEGHAYLYTPGSTIKVLHRAVSYTAPSFIFSSFPIPKGLSSMLVIRIPWEDKKWTSEFELPL